MKDDENTESPDNVIAFPDTRRESLLSGTPDCEGWTPLPPEYDLNDRGEFLAYMAAEAHVALKIQGLFGFEEANAWVQFHRGIYQPADDGDDESEDNDE